MPSAAFTFWKFPHLLRSVLGLSVPSPQLLEWAGFSFLGPQSGSSLQARAGQPESSPLCLLSLWDRSFAALMSTVLKTSFIYLVYFLDFQVCGMSDVAPMTSSLREAEVPNRSFY